jgi:hypothetical protein
VSQPLTPEQLAHPVEGHDLAPTTLGELLDHRTTLLVFVRHYG